QPAAGLSAILAIAWQLPFVPRREPLVPGYRSDGGRQRESVKPWGCAGTFAWVDGHDKLLPGNGPAAGDRPGLHRAGRRTGERESHRHQLRAVAAALRRQRQCTGHVAQLERRQLSGGGRYARNVRFSRTDRVLAAAGDEAGRLGAARRTLSGRHWTAAGRRYARERDERSQWHRPSAATGLSRFERWLGHAAHRPA